MSPTLFIPFKSGYRIIPWENIMLLEADSNYCQIHLNDGTRQMVSKTLKNISHGLQHSSFIRVHKSYLINIRFIDSIQTGKSMMVVLKNGLYVTVARSKRSYFLHYLQLNLQCLVA